MKYFVEFQRLRNGRSEYLGDPFPIEIGRKDPGVIPAVGDYVTLDMCGERSVAGEIRKRQFSFLSDGLEQQCAITLLVEEIEDAPRANVEEPEAELAEA